MVLILQYPYNLAIPSPFNCIEINERLFLYSIIRPGAAFVNALFDTFLKKVYFNTADLLLSLVIVKAAV